MYRAYIYICFISHTLITDNKVKDKAELDLESYYMHSSSKMSENLVQKTGPFLNSFVYQLLFKAQSNSFISHTV